MDSLLTRLQSETEVLIRHVNQFVPEAMLVGLVRASGFLLLTYDQHIGSSGFLMRAAGEGVPVLAQEFGLVGQLVREHHLGGTVDSSSIEAIAHGIDRSVRDPGAGFEQEAASAFARSHTVERFTTTLLSSLTTS